LETIMAASRKLGLGRRLEGAALAAALCLGTAAAAQEPASPVGYLCLSNSCSQTATLGGSQGSGPAEPAVAKASSDFDGDGKVDAAEIVKVGDAYEVRVRLAGSARNSILVKTLGSQKRDFFLGAAPSGRLATWCGKGGGSKDDPCEQSSVTLRGGELTFGVSESAQSVAIWTGGRFQVIQISD
jgi:hypothetical protein